MKGRIENLILLLSLGAIAVVIPVLVIKPQEIAAPQAQTIKLAESDLKEVVIQLERSGCYGNCPAYKLTIYGDGRVEY